MRKKIEFRSGKTMTTQARAKSLKQNWMAPSIPEGYDKICVFIYSDGEAVLDFLNEDKASFASEDIDVEIDSPWVDGFKPTHEDWDGLGITVITA